MKDLSLLLFYLANINWESLYEIEGWLCLYFVGEILTFYNLNCARVFEFVRTDDKGEQKKNAWFNDELK